MRDDDLFEPGDPFADLAWKKAEGPKPRSKWRREFVRVPWAWGERLQSVKRASTWRLAMLLLYGHWRTGGRDIALSNIAAQDIGLSCRSKSRVLHDLENLGRVKRRSGVAPRIALRHLKSH